ncbi:Rho GTPase activation protein [Panus rudis PR-1116 ss-1]|nr:Rho GTPase activation protein [Panus rudis PR-1116 ss-1]
MWKERLQQFGHRRTHSKRGNRNSRLRSNTTVPNELNPHEFTIIAARQGERPVTAASRTPTMDSPGHHPIPPTKASLKTWWSHFTAQKTKKEAEEKKVTGAIFGKPLKESLKTANVQITTANARGEMYVWGYVPVVVAKCGLYLKENATEIQGTFRVSGSSKRMRELQEEFERPPRYGKNLDWSKKMYTPHDVASVFRRFLTQMPQEPVIPHSMYHSFRDALAKKPYNQDEIIATYKRLIRSLPRPNQYLLLYVLDLLSVFARKADKNLMTAKNLAVIFRPALLSHPTHELEPSEHPLSQDVLEFLIAHQDWFMIDIPPAPEQPNALTGGASETEAPDVMPSSDDEQTGSWSLVSREQAGLDGSRIVRRRTTTERSVGGDSGKTKEGGDLSPVIETPSRSSSMRASTITRSRTLPSAKARLESGSTTDDSRQTKLLKKQKRASVQPHHLQSSQREAAPALASTG